MKLRIITGLIACALLGVNAAANVVSAQAPPSPHNVAVQGLTTAIDGVNVRDSVLAEIQQEFQSFAVTEARAITRGGSPHYRLRVNNDSAAGKGFYLTYDKDWKRVGDKEEISTPAHGDKKPSAQSSTSSVTPPVLTPPPANPGPSSPATSNIGGQTSPSQPTPAPQPQPSPEPQPASPSNPPATTNN